MTVSEQIIQVLDSLCEKFGMAIDWTSANVIPYVSELCTRFISWEIWTSVAWVGIMVFLCLVSVLLIKLCLPIFKRGVEANKRSYIDCGWEVGSVFAIAGLVVLYLATIIVIGCQIMDIIKCVTFPEMYIFEYVQGLINSGS